MSLEDEIIKLRKSIEYLCEKLDLDCIVINPSEHKSHDCEKNTIRNEFYNAPSDALFNEKIISIIVGCSVKLLQRERWNGKSIPFKKINGRVLYLKKDVIQWINKNKTVISTSE